MPVKCPQCQNELHPVTRPNGSMLNQYQFDAQKAGDWFCENCPDNNRGVTGLCYFWNKEIKFNGDK